MAERALWIGGRWDRCRRHNATRCRQDTCHPSSGSTALLFMCAAQSTLQSPNGVPYKGFVDAFKRVYHEEGAGKLFAGVQPRVLWISIGGALFLGMYEHIKSVFARDQEELSLL